MSKASGSGVLRERAERELFFAGQSQLYRRFAEERHQDLLLERREPRVRPGHGRVIGGVDEALRVAQVRLPCRADRDCTPVAESLVLLVTRVARLYTVT